MEHEVKQLELAVNKWWESTKTERWLLGNAEEVGRRVFKINVLVQGDVQRFVICHSLGLPGKLLIVAKPSEYTFHMCPKLLLKQLENQLGGSNELS